ncbi:MAG: hypothetical protein L6Q55_15050 [Azonexus sp.]|nr:hypothetical protein [Azonexus sp.]MCK6413719.1 hypothetical protein [Azonexus sp.]
MNKLPPSCLPTAETLSIEFKSDRKRLLAAGQIARHGQSKATAYTESSTP